MALLSKKFPSILGVLVLVAGIGFGVWYVNSKKIDQSGDTTPNGVRVTNTADNRFTVSWTTNVATTGKVKYGKLAEKISEEAGDDRDELSTTPGSYLTHHITIKDLQPTTVYAFRIESGAGKTLYDNNGAPYSVTTGPVIAATPPADAIYGQVQQTSTLPADGAIVYLAIPGAAPASTLVKSSGSYTIALSTLRSTDLKSYVKYDPKATIMKISVEQGKQQASADVSTTNAAPVPLITMGKTHDFTTPSKVAETKTAPIVAQVEPAASATPSATAAPVFNVESLGNTATPSSGVTISYPATEGEKISAARPELRGKGPKGTVISLVLQSGKKIYKDTIAIATNGQWLWAPTTDLTSGTYTLSLAYIDSASKEQTVKRGFVIDKTLVSQPAFVSTPSASVKPSASPKTATGSGRTATVATGSGVPVTGVIENTVLTAIFAAVMMVGGVLLFAL